MKSEPPRPERGGDARLVGGNEAAHYGDLSLLDERASFSAARLSIISSCGNGFLKLRVGDDDVARVHVRCVDAALAESRGDDAAGDALAVADDQVGDARGEFENCGQSAQNLIERIKFLIDAGAAAPRIRRDFLPVRRRCRDGGSGAAN